MTTMGDAAGGTVQGVLEAALRAPSAHNAQPWRLSSGGGGGYLLWYAASDRLLADPDDRDGIMALGGFFETLSLVAAGAGLRADLDFEFEEHSWGLSLGTIRFVPGAAPDPLSPAVATRQCNRNAYSTGPLPPGLGAALEELGQVLLAPSLVAPLVARASVMAWKDTRFVTDLRGWTRFDDTSADGMTVDCLQLTGLDQAALRYALGRGRLPAGLARLYAERDVRLTRASGAMAVLTAPDREPQTLFNCGRRLIRSWTLVNSLGYCWHPMSIVIDQPTVSELGALVGGQDPVAIYRVGHTARPAAWSKRRALERVLVPPPA